jgi:Holliday junction resolvase
MASRQQTRLIKQWQSKGYFVVNLVKITPSGLPDLIAIKPDEVIFIESKEKWDRLSALQKVKIKMLKQLGFTVYVNEEKK